MLGIVREKEIFPMLEHDNEHNTIAIYTVLSILVKMKNSLGLEAALEYIDKYLTTIEKYNPQIKDATSLAIKFISVEKIYKEAMRCEKE